MAGFTIHIAIGKKYIEKHSLEIKDIEQFYKGIISPDLDETMTEICKDKSKSHYGIWGNYKAITNIDEFLQDPKVDMSKDFWKGYFLHLLSDFYFYQVNFNEELKEIAKNGYKFYYDYDCLNKKLIEMYEIPIFDNISKYMRFVEGQPKYLKINKIIDYIEKISDFNIEDIVKIIRIKGMGGLK